MKGQKLGNYEIVDKLGEGGMGEVWRARDTRLSRFVALKVLPPDVAQDASRRQRFEAEARAVGALNHPNIVAVYDVGEQDGRAYMVSELVDGESLRSLISRGPVATRKLTDIAAQIADGLAAAHGLGIVHRDLKPENVMVTRDGRVKILDFGLAKQTLKPAGDETATTAFSQPGTVLGTVGYMSPEQVRSETVDQRSDIFSFGCILYELATGRRAFQAGSAAEVMSAILKDEPPELVTEAAPLPPALSTITRRCLEKRPEQRFQSAADLAFALRSISNLSGSHPAQIVPKARAKWLRPLLAVMAGLLLAASGYVLRERMAVTALPTFERLTFRQGHISTARFTSDGRNVIYAARWDSGPSRAYLATPGNPVPRDLEVQDGTLLLAVSATDDLALLVGPFAPSGEGTLARNSIAGGQKRELLEHVAAADWAPDGSMAVTRQVNGKWRLEYPVGNVLVESEWSIDSPRISPDGSQVAFCTIQNGRSRGLKMMDRSRKGKFLGLVSSQDSTVDVAPLAWTPDGKEIWFRSFDTREWGTIYAMNLAGRRRVIAHLPGRVTLHDISRDRKALITTDAERIGVLGMAPGENAERDLSILDASTLQDISPDGRVILADVGGESGGPKGSIYVRPTNGEPPVRLGDGMGFALSPDGKWVTSFSSKDAVARKFLLLPTGPGEERETIVPGLSEQRGIVVGWLAGEQNYLVMGALPGKSSGWQFFAWDAGRGGLRPVSPAGMSDSVLVSPDGQRFLAIGPDERRYVYSVSGTAPVRVEGLTAHDIPVNWRADSHSLYLRTHADTNKVLRVSILDLSTGQRTPWREIRPGRPVDDVSNLRVTPDGRAYAYNYTQATSDLYLAQGLN